MTSEDIERIQSRCACIRIDAQRCMEARHPISGEDEECECSCHEEIDDLARGDDEDCE